jgi:hypothetical protein
VPLNFGSFLIDKHEKRKVIQSNNITVDLFLKGIAPRLNLLEPSYLVDY